MNLLKSLFAFLIVFVSTLFTASDVQAFALGNHVGGFFLGTLDCADQNDLGTRDTCWENGWLSYDTTSGYCVATNKGSSLFDDTLRQVDNLDFSTPRNKSVFYSGPGNRSKALSFADDTGGVPIDFTSGGKYLDSLDLYSRLPASQADAIWSAASRNYATGASGKINLFTRGARSDRVFRTVEEPLLNSNIDVYKWTFHY